MNRKYLTACSLLIVFCFFSFPAYANKSAASINAPEKAAKGSTIPITINVTHNGNNFLHHTQWVYIKVNGKELERWEFKWNRLPENENISKEINLKVEEPLLIEVEASCNFHGSAGKATHKIELR